MARHPSTQLSLKDLRAREGALIVEVVEKFVHFPPPGHLVDLFNIFDIIALTRTGTIGVQCTSAGGFSARMKKLREAEATRLVLQCPGWSIEVHGWEKVRNRWTLTKHKRFELE